MDRLSDLVMRSGTPQLPAAEILRRLARAITDYQAGTLQDDATVVLLEWRPVGSRPSTPRAH
jgi:hypothetical protein